MPARVHGSVAGAVPVVAGLAVVVVGYFQPWVRSGARTRSSYELLGVADRLGVLGDGVARLLPTAWLFVPLVAAAAAAAVLTGRPRLGAGIATVVGLAALVVAAGVTTAPLPTERGVWIVVAGGVCTLVGALVSALSPTNRPSPRTGEPS